MDKEQTAEMETQDSTRPHVETAVRDSQRVSVFRAPALEVGIKNLKTAAFPPSSDAVFFLVGSSDEREDCWLIKVPRPGLQAGGELRASTVLGKRASKHFIVCGSPIQCRDPEFGGLAGFAMPYYPYSLNMLPSFPHEG